CREARLEPRGEGDIIKRGRRAKGQAHGPTDIIAQQAKHRLLGLERQGVRRFYIWDKPRRWWGAGHPITKCPRRVGGTIVVQEIGPEQMVVGDRRDLVTRERPPRRRWTSRGRRRRHTLLCRLGDNKALPAWTDPKDLIPHIDDNRLVMGDVDILIDHRTER